MKCKSRVPGHGGCLYGYVKDNYYARFHNPNYQRYRETHLYFNPRKILTKSIKHEMYVKVPGHGVCILAVIGTEKHTIISLDKKF